MSAFRINGAFSDSEWVVTYRGYSPADEGRREVIFALGNGMYVTRGASLYSPADKVHYPGTYRAGCYDQAVSKIAGELEEDVSLVNLPNWLPLEFRINSEPWFRLDGADLRDYWHSLDIRRGVAQRAFTFTDGDGRSTHVYEQRLQSMSEPHLAAVRVEVTPLNWSGTITFRSSIDGDVINNNVPRYGDYQRRHLEVRESGSHAPDNIWLRARTCRSNIDIVQAVTTRLESCDAAFGNPRQRPAAIRHGAHCKAVLGETLAVEKTAALFTSLDPGVDDALRAAQHALANEKTFAQLRAEHEIAWQRLWHEFDIEAQCQSIALTLRFHIFHLLQTVSPHTALLDAGVPARGWHGEGYRGHIFWDELFVFPVLNFRFPDVARSLLLYRYHRLDEARAAAREVGLTGAMFPWRSGPDGREATPRHQKNLLSGHWMKDPTHLQRHIGSAVAYNVWHYFLATDDRQFMEQYGAEIILEVARFWSSAATFSSHFGRYEIKGVIGPDEYHNSYPDRKEPGLDNNAYTNLMAVWTLCCALNTLEQLPLKRRRQLLSSLGIGEEELTRWDDISRRMRIVFHDGGIISQFEGFDQLREFNRSLLPSSLADKRIDWALEAVGETADAYQVTKQADTLTLFYLFRPDEIAQILARLGYRFSTSHLMRTADYYLARTTHRSSLSRVTYAGALAQVDLHRSWRFFKQALETDLHGLKGESIAEGIHLGAMGGTLDILQRRYVGIEPCVDGLRVNPAMPTELGEIKLKLTFRGNTLSVEASPSGITIFSAAENRPITLFYGGKRSELTPDTYIIIQARVGLTERVDT